MKNKERDKLMKGMDLVFKRLIAFKKQKGTEMVIMKNGKILKLKPEELDDYFELNLKEN